MERRQPLEALGHGDGAKAFQTFKLSRPNLTYLQAATSLEGTAALEVRVNGELWKETPSFFGRRGDRALSIPRARTTTAKPMSPSGTVRPERGFPRAP